MTTTNRNLQALKRKLERMELEHLRAHALELHEQIEQLQSDLALTSSSLDFWQRDAMNMQEALLDPEHANARQIGITRSGELLVVRTGGDHVEPGQH